MRACRWNRKRAAAMVTAVEKAILIDMEIAISVYIEAGEALLGRRLSETADDIAAEIAGAHSTGGAAGAGCAPADRGLDRLGERHGGPGGACERRRRRHHGRDHRDGLGHRGAFRLDPGDRSLHQPVWRDGWAGCRDRCPGGRHDSGTLRRGGQDQGRRQHDLGRGPADQHAGAERHDRGGAGGCRRQRLRRRRLGGEGARRPGPRAPPARSPITSPRSSRSPASR